MVRKLALILICACFANSQAQEKKFQIHTIAFYNVENLFDTIRDPKIYDEEWTPDGAQAWTKKKYEKKINNLTRVMSQIGTDENPQMPTIIGVAEVENRGVLEDLVKAPSMIPGDYDIVHYDSPDRRGIDVGLLYSKKHFIPTNTSAHPLYIYDQLKDNKRIYTRDQLLVTGLLDGEEVHFIVNHWPSRVGGEKASSPNREAAAALNMKIIDSLQTINPKAKIITMGDMNDGPYNKSIKKVLKAEGDRKKVQPQGLFNPMEKMSKDGLGTLAYRDAWDIFDQMILTEAYLTEGYDSWKYWKARIFKKPFMVQETGQYKGYPLRNSNSEPGYSDHFPVYIYLIKQQ
ncbi:endonuclease/exonuclease/phosphatase family protein [Myroides sp. 1354]|uniref:endonuclease/exonuclease/phosphatase family protein n=1 Tax=unclassified Myroides TaxID=2642485 RepID=UPI0025754B31|nr:MULTISPECIES: endonuclease/exonuclease/phosphatase family protein [unclassified Myroides]MDM1043563.1 endonuclease/exonuclease/phosphatase family protein [Myroides sp. R163-1]MDM1054387.1 endonuclease/exonuclease/phosphatase family protein [Myroides sp. 1354]MDM1067683.1 endonuclease/exonuclease/phosphatase family protein [Myroides sp. 1372]